MNLFDPSDQEHARPDFPALIPILQGLHQALDTETGETMLTPAEAANIRECGLEARAGLWRCPLLPDDVVWWIPVLRLLPDLYGPETRGERWNPRRAAVRAIVQPIDPLDKFSRRLLQRLREAPGQRLDRRALKRAFWREGTRFVDFTINRLIAEDYLTAQGRWLYPFSRSEFQAWQEAERDAQARPRRPVPVSTTW
jgi:hypothetical protein